MRSARTLPLAFMLVLLALVAWPVAPARAQGDSVQIETFYRELEPHGRWFQHAQYGYVWSPDVDPDWRPYTRGQWVFTEEHGWYWESEEPFGWAVFHYGRWAIDDDSGWIWVPGTEWGPAWVAWRDGDEQIGWAPLPPEAEWRRDHLAFSTRYYDSPRYVAAWCFVPVAVFTSYRVWRHLHPINRNTYFVRQTRFAPPVKFVDRRIYSGGIDRFRYQRIARKPIVPLRIVAVGRPHAIGPRPGHRTTIQVFKPGIIGVPGRVPPPRLGQPPRRSGPFVRPTQPTFLPKTSPPVQRYQPPQPRSPTYVQPRQPQFVPRTQPQVVPRAQPQFVPRAQPQIQHRGQPQGGPPPVRRAPPPPARQQPPPRQQQQPEPPPQAPNLN